jgi:hypothetical protein
MQAVLNTAHTVESFKDSNNARLTMVPSPPCPMPAMVQKSAVPPLPGRRTPPIFLTPCEKWCKKSAVPPGGGRWTPGTGPGGGVRHFQHEEATITSTSLGMEYRKYTNGEIFFVHFFYKPHTFEVFWSKFTQQDPFGRPVSINIKVHQQSSFMNLSHKISYASQNIKKTIHKIDPIKL